MVRDRLAEMKKLSKQKSVKKKGRFDPFLATIEDISIEIDRAESNADNIKQIQKKFFNEPFERDRKIHETARSELVEQNKNICRKLQKTIKEEQKKIEINERQGSLDRRTQLEQIRAVSQRYLNVWSDFNAGQVDFRERTKKRLLLSNKITNTDMTAEEVEQVLDGGGSGFYTACIMEDTAKAKEDLNHLESRQEAFLKLERSIQEVADMFIELQTIVALQHEMVDRIDANIGDAAICVKKGKKELWKALKKKISARKKKYVLVSSIVGGAVVTVIVVACLI